MAKRIIYIILMVILPLSARSQTGGDNVYEFLNLTHSSLVASLGATNVSLRNNDLNLAYSNPALLSPDMDKSLTLNYVNYFAGINYGMTMYSQSYQRIGSFAAGLTYLNYGSAGLNIRNNSGGSRMFITVQTETTHSAAGLVVIHGF